MVGYWVNGCLSVNEHLDQKVVVHLYDGILCSRKEEGAPTLCDSIDGTGKYNAK